MEVEKKLFFFCTATSDAQLPCNHQLLICVGLFLLLSLSKFRVFVEFLLFLLCIIFVTDIIFYILCVAYYLILFRKGNLCVTSVGAIQLQQE